MYLPAERHLAKGGGKAQGRGIAHRSEAEASEAR
jgi:hypothetical protein